LDSSDSGRVRRFWIAVGPAAEFLDLEKIEEALMESCSDARMSRVGENSAVGRLQSLASNSAGRSKQEEKADDRRDTGRIWFN